MRPEWLKCEGCLFFIPSLGDGPWHCRLRNIKIVPTEPDNFCAAWTCRRCLQPWRYSNINYEDDRRIWGWDYSGVNNHYECKEAGVHKNPERVGR